MKALISRSEVCALGDFDIDKAFLSWIKEDYSKIVFEH